MKKILCSAVFLSSSLSLFAADGSWKSDVDGSWGDSSKWAGGVIADGVGVTATFSLDTTVRRSVTLGYDLAVGNLIFNDTLTATPGGWALNDLNGSQELTMDVVSGSPTISVNSGSAAIGLRIDGADGLIKNGAGTLSFGRSIGNHSTNQPSDVANPLWGGFVINNGVVALRGGGLYFDQGYFYGTAFTINAGGVLDVGLSWNLSSSNSVVINGGVLSFADNGIQEGPNYANSINSTNGIVSATNPGGGFRSGNNTLVTHTFSGDTGNTVSANVYLVKNGGAQTVRFLVNDGASASDLTVSGVIADVTGFAGSTLEKAGAGRLLLNATNTYTGPTLVSAGTLGGTGSIAGAVSVASGAKLMGGAGAASGSLSVGGDVTLASGSIIQLALGSSGTHSALARTGGVWSFDGSQKFTFLDLGAQTGTYAGLITGLSANPGNLSGWTITNAGWSGTFQYNAGSIDFVLTAVPEPSTYGLIGAGSVAAVAMIRRRRNRAKATTIRA